MSADATYLTFFADGHCLSTGAMRQYLDGTLPRQSVRKVEKHLLDCDFCSHILEDMDVAENAGTAVNSITTKVNSRITDLIGSAPRLGIWMRFRTYFAGGAAALLIAAGIILYTHSNTNSVSAPLSAAGHKIASSQSATPEPEPAAVVPAREAEFSPVPTASGNAAITDKSSLAKTDLKNTAAEVPAEVLKNTPPPVEAMPSSVAVKESPSSEPLAAKEIFSNLQIVSARMLQKVTKTEGSSRNPSKKGQLGKTKSRSDASFKLEDMPQYPGGDAALEEYIIQHFKNPVKDKRELTGKAVGVFFTVSSKGKVSDIEITRSISPELDIEIIRLLSAMPSWIPGNHRGDITCVLALTVQ